MPPDPREKLVEKYERSGWPAEPRPDGGPAPGWSIALLVSINRPRSHTPSPDGSRIAFFWDRDDHSDLYVMSVAGGWPLQLTFDRDPAPYWFDDPPQWSPDGRWLALTDKGHVWVVSPEGGLPRLVSRLMTEAGSPRWMPDSRGLLVTTKVDDRSRIVLTDREGEWPRPVSQGPGHDLSPAASPDGCRVAYVHRPPADLNRSDIMLADLQTGAVVPLTAKPSHQNLAPRWSPNGRYIAFTSERTGYYELFIIDVEAGSESQVTRAGADLSDIEWSPDGSRILCRVHHNGAFDLVAVEPTTGQLEDVRTTYGVHACPHWLPDGRAITFEYDDPHTPPDIYRMDLATGQVTQLTFSSPPALKPLGLVTPQRVSYPSFDGLDIPAFLYRPRQPNGAAVLYPHGGPTDQYSLEWDAVAQYFVAKGYTWLAPNIRGSTGYGLAFERANHDACGIDDTKDCLAGADYLASLPGVDRERIAIFGASYGAYMAVCALAFDPQYRFACGVAKYGFFNNFTGWAQSNAAGREDQERLIKHPRAARAIYAAGSPVLAVDRIQKPLLIVHGLRDEICHPLQSEELVEALQRAGKTYEYKTYADEGHGLLRRDSRIDFQTRLERFLDWYLL